MSTPKNCEKKIETTHTLARLTQTIKQMTKTNLLGIANFPSTLQNKEMSDMVDKEPIVQKAMTYVRTLVEEYEKVYSPSWKTKDVLEVKFFSSMQKYSYLKKHSHLECNYAGIIYLEVGHDVPPLKIFDVNPYNSDTMQLVPRNGSIVIIPAWMEHSLDQKLNDESRKVFTFNL
jgi:hypothetical protein